MTTTTAYGKPADYVVPDEDDQDIKDAIAREHEESVSVNEVYSKPSTINQPGVKFDSGKAKLSMIPKEALEQLAQVMEYGAKKYGRDNYKGGMDYTRIIDAALRHLYAFNSGESNDPESKLSHLGHCMANCAMLMYYVANNKGKDDR